MCRLLHHPNIFYAQQTYSTTNHRPLVLAQYSQFYLAQNQHLSVLQVPAKYFQA